jgi:hypothetical protein
MSQEFDLERSMSAAWHAFRSALADYLGAMTDADSLVIEVLVGDEPEQGSQPYVQFAGFGGDHLRGEVSSNQFLAPQHALSPAAERRLIALGWQEPETDNFFVHVPTTSCDELADLAVRTLREVFEVAHPAFLITPDARDAAALGIAAPTDAEPATVDVDEPLAVVPEDHDHLVALVDGALVQVFGAVPVRDEDGDIPVPYNSTLLFIRVRDDDPVIELFSFVVRGVTDRESARVEVGILNRDLKFIKFVANEDWIFAQIQVPAYPFVPMQLRSMLHYMSTTLDEIDDDLAVRTGGRRALEPEEPAADPESQRLPPSGRAGGVKALYREFWTIFQPYAAERGWTTSNPPPRHWWSMPAGGQGNSWSASFTRFGCRVELYLGHPDPEVNLYRLRALQAHSAEIQRAMGDGEVVFDELPGKVACRIEVRLKGPRIADRERWPSVVDWMVEHQQQLRGAIETVGGVPTSFPR